MRAFAHAEDSCANAWGAISAHHALTGGAERWLSGDPCGVAPYYCGFACGGWRGIHCWGPGGHVRRVELRGTSGTLPTQIGLLSELAALELPGGGLSGTVPSELGRLRLVNSVAAPG